MACSNNKFKTSEASSKSRLRTEGAVDKDLNIIDYNKFTQLNNKWTDEARIRFQIEGKLFFEKDNKAVSNEEAFKKIDISKGLITTNPIIDNDNGINTSELNRGNTPNLNELNSILENYLKQFGFSTEQLEDLQEVTGYSIIGATDFLEKTIFVKKNNINAAYTKEAANSIFNLLGKKNLLRKDLIYSIHLVPNYENLKSKYINSNLSDYKIRELIAADYLQSKLIEAHKEALPTTNKALSKDVTASNKLEYIILKIKQWWSDIIREYLKNYKRGYIEDVYNQIANDVINNNTRLFSLSKNISYNKMELKDDHKEINASLVELGAINSGSYSLNKQGTLTRETMNDLDYFLPYSIKDDFIKNIIKKYPQAKFSEPFAGIMGNRSLTLSLKINDTKIDLFLPTSQEESDKNKIIVEDNIKYHHWKNIFDAKVRIGSQKHLSDLAGFVPFKKEWSVYNSHWRNPLLIKDPYLDIIGQRHYNFDFIQSKFNKEKYSSNDSITPSDNIKTYWSKHLEQDANNYFKNNNIDFEKSIQYQDILLYFNYNKSKAIVSYYLTFSENFKKFYGNISSRKDLESFKINYANGNYSKPSILLDENNEPVVFYHGAGTKFDKFSKDYFLSGEGAMAYGAGFYSTNYKPTADNYRDTSKAAYEKFQELLKKEDEALLELIKGVKTEITEDNIIHSLQASGGNIFFGEDIDSRTKFLDLLGLTETKALYISLTNPLYWQKDISSENKSIIESHFGIKLRSIKSGEVYRELEKVLKISDKELSARLYQIGIDGVINIAGGGRAMGGFSHKKGEIHAIFFEPVQAKSVNNSGLFSLNNENMYDPIEVEESSQEAISSEKSQTTVLLQKNDESTISSEASPETIKIIKDFLQRIGVNYNKVKGVIINGTVTGNNAIANMLQKLIEVVEGHEASALPEEAMHFAVEIIQQTNPVLFNKLLKEINNYTLLKSVFAQYSSDPNYQTADGKPDVLKLKKEAIAKVLVETIIKKNEGSTEKSNLLNKVEQSWWKQILDWLKELVVKSGFDQAAIDILTGKNIGTASDIRSSESYFQKSVQQTIFDSIVEMGKKIKLKPDPSSTTEKDSYFIGDHKIGRRVSDLVHDWYGRRFADHSITETEFDKSVKDLKAEKGTAGHADFEHAFSLFVGEDGKLKSKEERDLAKEDDSNSYISKIDPDDTTLSKYLILRDNLEERLLSYGEDTLFLSEQIIYDEKRDIAGTVDFIAITKEGYVNILDWKFMDLNIDKYEDVPWFKVNAWHKQMEQYKYIISRVHGVDNNMFKHTRMIPIKTYYSKQNRKEGLLPRLLSIDIGDVNIKNIEEDYLLPVGIEQETTGNKRVDDLLIKLNAIYKKLGKQKALPSEKLDKAEQLNALFSAIRQLQIKQNIKPLIRQAKILNLQIERIIQKFDNIYVNEDGSYKDAKQFEDKELNDFSSSIGTAREALQVYTKLNTELGFLFKGELSEEDEKLMDDLKDTVSDVQESLHSIEELDVTFTDKFIGGSENVRNLATPEKIIKGLTKLFGTTATLQMKSLETLYKKTNKVFGYAAMDTRDEIKRLEDLRVAYMSWADGKGLNNKNYFDIIKKKDKNELIDEFNSDFYKEFNTRVEDKDFAWILDNIDTVAYTEYITKKLEEEIERIKAKSRIGTDNEISSAITYEITKAQAEFNVKTSSSFGWLRQDAKKFPNREKWESTEWKKLNSKGNEAALNFYNYIKERNEYYKSIGYIHAREARVFLPWVRKGLTEKLIFGGNVTMGEQFLRNITVDESDIGYGQIDPLTGKPMDTIPIMLTTKLDTDYSTDLFKTMGLYNEFAIKFKYLTDIEAQARALIRLERNKPAIATSLFGKTEYDKNTGIAAKNPDNSSNAQLLEDMVKSIVYQQKYISNESFDQVLGKIGNHGKKINDKLGFKLLPEDLEGRVFSINKTITQINNTYQTIALGLNVLSATSNLFGGTTQAAINSGKYFTKSDFVKTELWLLANKMNGRDKQKNLAALEYFMPFTDNFNREANNKLSISKLNQEGVQDFLMVLMRNSDKSVQTTNFFAFINNSIVHEGKVLNAREFVRTYPEFTDMYAGGLSERTKRSENFEKEVSKLLSEKSVLKLSTVDDKGNLIIPGVNRKDNSIIEVRRKVQQFTSDALGNMSEENKRLINMSVYGKSVMVFKNWIPRLIDVRTGNLKYNSASDAYEWGRTRMIVRVVSEDLHKSLSSLLHALRGTDKGIERLRKLYEDKKVDYELDTGKELEMTESEFIALARQNIQNQVYDTMLLLALSSMLFALKGLMPDDDEDPAVLNRWRFMLKATDKLKDELGYFYNPANIFSVFQRGIFPSTTLIDNYIKALDSFRKEMYGLATGDDELVEDTKVIKYWMKSFPLTSQLQAFIPMFSPELAKDLGIRTQSNYGR